MLLLAAWLSACFAAAILLRNRPLEAVIAALALWLMIPALGAASITGLKTTSPIAFHPATWLILVVSAVQLVGRPRPIVGVFARHPYVILMIAIFTAGAGLTTVLSGSGGLRLLTNQVIAPALLFILVLAHARGERQIRWLRNTVVACAALQALIALVQWALGDVLFFAAQFETQYWFRPDRNDRWMGTTDGPLTLALLLAVAGAFVLGLSRVAARLMLLALFTVAMLITQSRTGAIVMVLLVLISVGLMRMRLWVRALSGMAVAVAGVGIVALGVTDGLFGRLANDTGSTNARNAAWDFVFGNLGNFLVGGGGFTSSYAVARDAGLQTSIESSFLMYAIDVGLVLAAAYFGAQIALLVRYGPYSRAWWATLASLIAVVLVNISSALAFSNLAGPLLWLSLGLVVCGAYVAELELTDGVVVRRVAVPSAA